MDEIELLIARELAEDAQIPFNKIAKKLGISPETVRKKFEKMKKERTITQSSIMLDLTKIGYEYIALLKIKSRPNYDRLMTTKHLERTLNIIMIGKIVGNFDVFAFAAVKNLKNFAELLIGIKKLPSVERVETSFMFPPIFQRKTVFQLLREKDPKF
jgi:Lrp/AsnC family transcriptional regulator for asnA, asnC and gidA